MRATVTESSIVRTGRQRWPVAIIAIVLTTGLIGVPQASFGQFSESPYARPSYLKPPINWSEWMSGSPNARSFNNPEQTPAPLGLGDLRGLTYEVQQNKAPKYGEKARRWAESNATFRANLICFGEPDRLRAV